MKPHMKMEDGMWHCKGALLLGCFPFELIYVAAGSGLSVRSAYMDWANKLVPA